MRAAFFVLDQTGASDALESDRPRHTGLEARLAEIVFDPLAAMGYDLVRIAVLGRDQPTVQIMADRADGSLIGIADCEAISQAVGPIIDVADPMPAAWTLEVSSAGIDRPLTRKRDWNRFSGHQARIELDLPVDGRKRATGVVLGADADQARLRLDDGHELAVRLDNIRRAKLVLTDALIAATAPGQLPRTN